MKCLFCEGIFKKSKLIFLNNYAHCPVCGGNLVKISMFKKHKNIRIKTNVAVKIAV